MIKMKIKLVVLYVNEDRKKYIEEQLNDLCVTSMFDIDYYRGFIPCNSVNYINYKNEKHPEEDGTICCCRSYFSIFDMYSSLDYNYVLTIEDDVRIITSSLYSKILDIIEIWNKFPDIEYVSLGYLLSFNYKEIKATYCEDNFYYNIFNYNKVWGTQMVLFKKDTLIKLSKFNVSTASEFNNLISDVVIEYTSKYKRIQIDSILPLLCKYGMVYPPLAIENNNIKSEISLGVTRDIVYKDHPEVNFSLYYNTKKYNKTIGLSFGVPDTPINMFSNGHRQNVLYFFEVLYLLGYDVYLILDKPMVEGVYSFNYKKYKTVLYDTDLHTKIQFDIVFQVGFLLPIDFLRKLKKQSCKLISYKCGCDYVFDLENSLFSGNKNLETPQHSSFLDEQIFDVIWCIPQLENLNYHYWKTLYKCPVVIVPFIWSNKYIESFAKLNNLTNDGIYKSQNTYSNKKIAIFEPNLNVVKFALPCILICENTYRSNPDLIKSVYITNCGDYTKNPNSTFNHTHFSRLLYSLNLYKDKKLSSEGRYQTIMFMNKHADIAVCHQWENPLNYLYIELAWMGFPILHNAYLCSDIGYYYEGFNYEQAGKMLEDIIKTHDHNAEYYLYRNRRLIDRYLPTNIKLQNTYKDLIENLCRF